MTLGKKLANLRKSKNLSQLEVAKSLGINNKTLSGYENGVSEPDIQTLSKLANLYGVSLDEFVTNEISINSFGMRLKKTRKTNGFTQKELANKLGISSQVISNWERNYSSPDDKDLLQLSKIFDVTTDYLLGVEDEEPNNHSFGTYLKTLRKMNGLTLHFLADKTEVSKTYLSKIEAGKRNPPSKEILSRMAPVLGVSVEELLQQAFKKDLKLLGVPTELQEFAEQLEEIKEAKREIKRTTLIALANLKDEIERLEDELSKL